MSILLGWSPYRIVELYRSEVSGMFLASYTKKGSHRSLETAQYMLVWFLSDHLGEELRSFENVMNVNALKLGTWGGDFFFSVLHSSRISKCNFTV